MTNQQATSYLRSHGACAPALEWFGDRDPRTAWETCENDGWMRWLATRCGLWTDATRDAYVAAYKPAWDAYVAAYKPARDTYVAAYKPARDTYDAAYKQARGTFYAAEKPARDTYVAAVKLAWDAYDAACCDAIRSLVSFDEIARAIEKEEAQ